MGIGGGRKGGGGSSAPVAINYARSFTQVTNPPTGGAITEDTFVPTVSGSYNLRYSLGRTSNQLGMSLGTSSFATDVYLLPNSTKRLGSGGSQSVLVPIILTAGVTYHIGVWAGGSTGVGEMIVEINKA